MSSVEEDSQDEYSEEEVSGEEEDASEDDYTGPVLQEAIVKAIKEGDVMKVEEWLSQVAASGDDISTFIDVRKEKYTIGDSEISTRGMTALHHAAFYCQPVIAQKLLDAGADPTVTNSDDENALHVAMESESDDCDIENVASILLQKRRDYIDATTGSSAWTALLIAVYLNHQKTVLKLLECGADPNKRLEYGEDSDRYRYGLLLASLHEGDMLKWFIDRGCDVNQGDGKFSALHYAVKYFKPDNVKLLVKHGADMWQEDAFGFCPIHYCIGATSNSDFISIVSTLKRSIDVQDRDGQQTLLHLAVIQGKTEYVRILRHKFNTAYSSRRDSEGRLPIHYLSGQPDVGDLVDLLGEATSTLNAKDFNRETPLHIAVQKNDPEFVKVLLQNGADPTITAGGKEKLQLVHLAVIARGTDRDFSKMLETLEEIEGYDISQPDANGRTALHWALDTKEFSKARILLEAGADPSPVDINQKNCLHIAFHRSCPGDVVTEILKRKQGLEVVKDIDGNTPLHYLSARTPVEAIKALEDFDVTINSNEQVQITLRLETSRAKNKKIFVHPSISSEKLLQRAKTEFDRADIVVEYYSKNDDAWLELGPELVIAAGDTFKVKIIAKKKEPLDTAIELKRLDVVKLLLVKGAKLTTSTLKDAIVREDSELAFILIRHAKDIISPLTEEIPRPSYSGEGHHQEEKKTTLFRELICRMPNVAKEALENCVTLGNNHEVEFDYTFVQPSKPDGNDEAEKLLPSCTKTESDDLENPLELMVRNKQIQLLQHPVVWSYLYLKWNALGFWFYASNLFLFGLFLSVLCLFVVAVNDPLSDICRNRTSFNESAEQSCGSLARERFSYVMAVLVIFLALYHLIVEVFRMVYDIIGYLKDVRNYVEILLYVFCIVFVFNFANECGCPRSWQWQIGIFVVFLGWINLIFFASRIPRTGIYVLVFKEILITFLKLVAFALLLVSAFSLILYMMFSSPDLEIASFKNVGISFVKTLTMVTGEFGFEDLFGLESRPEDYSPGEYYVSNYIMWIIFLVLLPIILNNMLTSLAVGDAKDVIENAELKKLILQVKTVVLAEEVVPNCIKKRTVDNINQKKTFKLDELKSPWNIIRLFIFGGTNYLENLEDNTYFVRRKEEQDEIKGQGTADDETLRQTKEDILQRLSDLFDLVLTNEEYMRKCQKHDQQVLRIVGKL